MNDLSVERPARAMIGCTCGRLRKLSRRVTQIYDHMLEPQGISIQQFGLLAPLQGRGDMSMGEFADYVVSDPTTLTRNLKPLERDGYIAIKTAPDDRRRKVISITDKGREKFHAALPQWREAQRQVAEALGEAKYTALNAALVDSLEGLRP